MPTQFEYTVIDETFDLSTDPIPHNRQWNPFSSGIQKVGNKIWIRGEAGVNYSLLLDSGSGDILKYAGIWSVGSLKDRIPFGSVKRRGMYMLTMLVRPVADTNAHKVLNLTVSSLRHGDVRIDAYGAISGDLMWSETYGARDSVRGADLRDTIQDHLVDQCILTRSSPHVRLVLDGAVVRGNKILKHPTEFGQKAPVRPQYPKTPYMNTIRCHFKRK